MKKGIIFTSLHLLIFTSLPVFAQTVRISTGLVRGHDQEGTIAFKGIPYCRFERLELPRPAEKWDTVMACDHYSPETMQHVGGRFIPEGSVSETGGQYLNVWTSDLKGRKPVMVWLHGGGFDTGSAGYDSNAGYGMAKKGVVMVGVNHRLNIHGFLDLSACGEQYRYSGNAGMLDIVAALEWIRDNISAFGGDPDNVTIFGESGGGGKVGTLMCMPQAKGLFHKAIIQSGTILNVNTKEITQPLGLAVLEELGIATEDAEQVKNVPYDSLYAAGQRALRKCNVLRTPGTPIMYGFGPVTDGESLLMQPFQPGFAEISSDVPLLIGTDFNELQLLRHNYYKDDLTLDQAREILQKTFLDDTDDYIQAFLEAYPDATPQDMLGIDWMFRPKTMITADAASREKRAPVYTYLFTWRSPSQEGKAGSVHGYELPFCFNTLKYAGSMLPEPEEKDLKFADLMCESWTNFAKTGNPNVKGTPEWHPYTPENGEVFVFDYTPRILNNHDRRLQEIINKHCF